MYCFANCVIVHTCKEKIYLLCFVYFVNIYSPFFLYCEKPELSDDVTFYMCTE